MSSSNLFKLLLVDLPSFIYVILYPAISPSLPFTRYSLPFLGIPVFSHFCHSTFFRKWCLTTVYRHSFPPISINLIIKTIDVSSNGDSTDQDFDLTADMMVHDMDDETTLEEEELNEDSENTADELAELEKVEHYFTIQLLM